MLHNRHHTTLLNHAKVRLGKSSGWKLRHYHNYFDRVQRTCSLVAFQMAVSKMGTRSAMTLQSVATFRVSLEHQDCDEAAIRQSVCYHSVTEWDQTGNVFVIIQGLSLVTWHVVVYIHRNSY